MVELLEPRIREIADELLGDITAKSQADIVQDFTYPLPVIVIAEILGVPTKDRADFKRWSDAAVATLGVGINGEPPPVADGVIGEMREYFTAMMDERRREPRPDLISGLVAAEIDGEKLTAEDIIQMLVLLLIAGNETTTNLIGNAVLEFIEHPDQLQRVLADPSLVPSAIEEVLRFSSPVQATVRRATADIEVNGKTIAAGQRAIIWLASCNRDETAFDDPETFDIGRNPNRHLAFGLGPHFCLGSPLARLEAKVALEEMLPRLRNFKRLNNDPLPRVPTFIMHGLRSLPITFDAVPARPRMPEAVR
jgi:cytochrome P450